MTSASSAAAPNAAATASTPTSPWPRRSSQSVPCGPPGPATAGVPGPDHHGSADLLADALRRTSGVLRLAITAESRGVTGGATMSGGPLDRHPDRPAARCAGVAVQVGVAA